MLIVTSQRLRAALVALTILSAGLLTACVGPTTVALDPEGPPGDITTFVAVVDGDTVETSAGTVRLIGIDTPERGECGHDQARDAIWNVISVGDTVRLELPDGPNDVDRYGRLLRFVTTADGTDVGLLQLEAGNAVARYDSRDGYPAHPREEIYHASQLASRSSDGSVLTTQCQNAAPGPVPSVPDGAWWEQYSSCVRVKSNTAGHPIGPFHRDDPAETVQYEWFAHGTGNNGDGDGDGVACE